MKKIEAAKEELTNLKDKMEEVVDIEDCEDTDEKDSDISDIEAARVFLRNKNGGGINDNKQKVEPNKRQTGTKPKIFKCGKCGFEVQTEAKLKGHSTIHEKGNVNYVEMVKCSRCEYVFKTVGLLRRHLKSEHGINFTSIPEVRMEQKVSPDNKLRMEQKQE